MKYIVATLLFINCTLGFAQEPIMKTKKTTEIDFFKHDYKYLDANYTISIDSKKFDSIVRAYEFYTSRITKYKDSLSVVLIENFKGDWKKANKATFLISYTWERLSYHLWLDSNTTKQLAKKFNFYHPYLFKQFLLTSNNQEVVSFFHDLKGKIKEYTKSSIELDQLTRKQLLNFAMRNSKSRIKGFNSHRH